MRINLASGMYGGAARVDGGVWRLEWRCGSRGMVYGWLQGHGKWWMNECMNVV